MLIEPLGTQVLISKYVPEIKKKSGIILPDDVQERFDAEKMPFLMGKVLATGQFTKYIKKGDLVIYERHTPIKFTYGGKEYEILKEEYVTARIKEDQKVEA